MIKPLFINRGCYFQHSPCGDCLRSFINNLKSTGWNPIIYASKVWTVEKLRKKIGFLFVFTFFDLLSNNPL